MFAAQRKNSGIDLEAVETATRASALRAGIAVLAGLLSTPGGHASRVSCRCGGEARYHDQRGKQILTAVGPVEFERAYYVCPLCHRGHSPRDRELDVEATAYSPGVRRIASPRTSAPISKLVSSSRFSAPNNWNCRRFAPPPCQSSTSRWTVPAFRS